MEGKTSEGKDVMMSAPCDISDKQKEELGIIIKKKEGRIFSIFLSEKKLNF